MAKSKQSLINKNENNIKIIINTPSVKPKAAKTNKSKPTANDNNYTDDRFVPVPALNNFEINRTPQFRRALPTPTSLGSIPAGTGSDEFIAQGDNTPEDVMDMGQTNADDNISSVGSPYDYDENSLADNYNQGYNMNNSSAAAPSALRSARKSLRFDSNASVQNSRSAVKGRPYNFTDIYGDNSANDNFVFNGNDANNDNDYYSDTNGSGVALGGEIPHLTEAQRITATKRIRAAKVKKFKKSDFVATNKATDAELKEMFNVFKQGQDIPRETQLTKLRKQVADLKREYFND